MAEIIPWPEAENVYAGKFLSKKGAPALSVRMALGSLIIKEKLGLSDQETVDQIKENPYLQYFIGLERYQNEAPFDASMLMFWFSVNWRIQSFELAYKNGGIHHAQTT